MFKNLSCKEGEAGSIPGQVTRIPHSAGYATMTDPHDAAKTWCSQINIKKQNKRGTDKNILKSGRFKQPRPFFLP